MKQAIERPGYFGRHRDKKIAGYNEKWGRGRWNLEWNYDETYYPFREACENLYERSADSEGFRFGPGNVPFFEPTQITQPSLCPKWANPGSVEDFWQSNKYLVIENEF
jgi:hypothetical protein